MRRRQSLDLWLSQVNGADETTRPWIAFTVTQTTRVLKSMIMLHE
jgi:hypothetical protein